MAQGDPAETGEDPGQIPDSRLTELLRAPTAMAYPALQELRRRHQPAALAYARLCAAGESAARRLAAEALGTAARETARGVEPTVPLRHRLLLLTVRSAASWAADERSAGVDPGLLLVLNTTGLPDGPTPPLLPAFQTLPSRTQGLLWYGVLEAEPEERTAAYLGVSQADVTHGTPQALKALAQACLRHRLAASDDPRCADFRRLIEEAVRPDGPRHSADLDAHRAQCPHCTAAFEDLTALRDSPRRALAEGLLPWNGTAYIRQAEPSAAHGAPLVRPGRSARRGVLLASAALGVALVPLLVLLLTPAHSSDQQPAVARPMPPAATVTATVSVTPTPSSPTPSPSVSRKHMSSPSPSPSPSRTRSAAPSQSPLPKPSPTYRLPGSAYAQIVNVASGLCLDVRDGYMANGTDVVTASCTSSPSQRWRLDARLGVLRSYADPDYCLDSRGQVYRSIGIWQCDTVYGSYGQNVTFSVDSRGVIHPAIAADYAVTPYGGDAVSLVEDEGRADQRWRAGAS